MDGVYFMDAEITPARSLSRRGLVIVMGITIGLGAIPVITFVAMGAHLVLPFVGVDILGLWLAFYVMNRKVSAERVRVSSDLVEVLKDNKPVWSSPTAFTRVEPGETAVRLAIHSRRLAVAQALSPGERAEFAGALAEAIRKARGAQYPGA
jgi:uncharacterized membrane protein